MASYKDRRTPGVYITEFPAFPPSVVGIKTAIPAFIGYTETAVISGKPVYKKAIPIGSMADYMNIFGGGYKPEYDIEEVFLSPPAADTDTWDFKVLDSDTGAERYYSLSQNSESRYNLYRSMKLFYDNGGADCYVVSVGNYKDTPQVELAPLLEGLDVIADQMGPTMLVVPDAVLLAEPFEYNSVANAMLLQAGDKKDRVALLDIYGTEGATKEDIPALMEAFRSGVGGFSPDYGMAYFPFLKTTVYPVAEVSYLNIAPSSIATLQEILTWENDSLYPDPSPSATSRHAIIQGYIDAMAPASPPGVPVDPVKLNQNLTAALPLLLDIEKIIVAKNSVLPPSGAMAGVYTYVDQTKGVWNAPANIGLLSVLEPTLKIDNLLQEDLNMPVDGKAVNAIRPVTGLGTVVWGARTLDGNSADYRYIQVRRTLIYMEQSIRAALNPFVFAANDANTWTTVVSMVSNFLQGLWSQGGLMGATPSEAFSVQCGIGSTMTGEDILNGYMIVQIIVQMIRPAEFIELTFKQKMEGVG